MPCLFKLVADLIKPEKTLLMWRWIGIHNACLSSMTNSSRFLGAKGIGELPTVAAPAAITNAVMDALYSTGVRHIDTPLTPEKIWRAINR